MHRNQTQWCSCSQDIPSTIQTRVCRRYIGTTWAWGRKVTDALCIQWRPDNFVWKELKKHGPFGRTERLWPHCLRQYCILWSIVGWAPWCSKSGNYACASKYSAIFSVSYDSSVSLLHSTGIHRIFRQNDFCWTRNERGSLLWLAPLWSFSVWQRNECTENQVQYQTWAKLSGSRW